MNANGREFFRQDKQDLEWESGYAVEGWVSLCVTVLRIVNI